jgi:hypothetical protein
MAEGVRAAAVRPVAPAPAAGEAAAAGGVVVPVLVDAAPAGAGEPHTSHQPSS